MKITRSILTLALALTFTSFSYAEEGHGNLSEKMNSLFPAPVAKKSARELPSKPELKSPDFFSKVNSDKVTLTWNPVDGADEYHVQVATDANFKWLVADEAHAKGNSFDVSSLEGGKQYFWRVAAVNNKNWSTFRKSFFASSMFQKVGTQK